MGGCAGSPRCLFTASGEDKVEVGPRPRRWRNAGTGQKSGNASSHGGKQKAVGPDVGARLKWGKCTGFLSHETTDTRVYSRLPHSASTWDRGHCTAPQRAKQAALLRTFWTQWNSADGKTKQTFVFLPDVAPHDSNVSWGPFYFADYFLCLDSLYG